MLTHQKPPNPLIKYLEYTVTPFSLFLWFATLLCFFAYSLDTSNFENVTEKKICVIFLFLN
jgi:hypothetical protein